MQQILEFSEIEIPEKNPNHPNDIYKKNADGGVFFILLGIACTVLFSTLNDAPFFTLNDVDMHLCGSR